MSTVLGCIVTGVVAMALWLAGTALSAWLVAWGWNLAIAPMFGLSAITFSQSLALVIMVSILGGVLRGVVYTYNSSR